VITPALDIVGLGLATVDVLIRLQDMPTWESPSLLSSFGLDGGGPVATACVAASLLGARVGYLGPFGNDLLGEIKLRTLKERGVELSKIVHREQPEMQVILVYVQESTGERIFTGLRDWEQLPLLMDELDREYITSARYLHLDGSHMATALQAASWMKQAGKPVSLDGSRTDGGPLSPEMVALVRQTDILICGSGFTWSLTGCKDLWEAGFEILAMGPQLIVQTEGVNGCYTITKQEQFHTPAFEVDVVDTTGAGDVFHGAYLVGLIQGWDYKKTAQFASAVAAIKCTQLGGRQGIPSFAETLAFLRKRGIP
jgi:sulfofructose kinase